VVVTDTSPYGASLHEPANGIGLFVLVGGVGDVTTGATGGVVS
jgi:hypothetical protein